MMKPDTKFDKPGRKSPFMDMDTVLKICADDSGDKAVAGSVSTQVQNLGLKHQKVREEMLGGTRNQSRLMSAITSIGCCVQARSDGFVEKSTHDDLAIM